MPLSSRGIWVARLFVSTVLVLTCGTLVLAQRPTAKGDQKPDPAAAAAAQAKAQSDQQEIQNMVRAADAAMSGQAAPSDFPIQFQNDFLKAQGSRVWVPVILTLDPAKTPAGALTLYLRVTPRGMSAPSAPPAAAPADKNAKDSKDKKKDQKGAPVPPPAAPTYPFEDATVLPEGKPGAAAQPLRIQRGLGVPAGSYDVYIVLHEHAAGATGGKMSVLKQPLDVPNYGSDFSTSTVILAERVDQLPTPMSPDAQSEHPYAFGATEIVVAPDRKFKKDQELIVLLQLYNPLVTDGKFNLEAQYTFYQQEAGTEKRFNATAPQTFSTETMGPDFKMVGACPATPVPPAGASAKCANGEWSTSQNRSGTCSNNGGVTCWVGGSEQSIQAGQGVPLQSFPAGNYRLEIKITDKLSSKVLTQNVNFTVNP